MLPFFTIAASLVAFHETRLDHKSTSGALRMKIHIMGSRCPGPIRTLLLASLIGVATTPVALGQQAPATTASSSDQLEEVVVSAQRRTENLQTTPIAITAITAASLEARNLDNISDVGAYVPNAVIAPLGAGWGATMAAFIRGVGLGDNILSFEPGVPIYVDDVYIGRPQGSIFDLLDLERVEILRGPQGTLFGKNAIGGAVRLISKAPSGSDTGYLEAG